MNGGTRKQRMVGRYRVLAESAREGGDYRVALRCLEWASLLEGWAQDGPRGVAHQPMKPHKVGEPAAKPLDLEQMLSELDD